MAPLRNWLLILSLYGLIPLYGGEAPFAGSVKTVSGEVKILRGSQALDAKVGIHVEVNDRIVSGAAGRVGLILRDGTRISLGPATEFVVEKFAYDPDQGLFALAMKLLRGSAVYISGKVASFAPAAVKLETPVGSVGLRGTRFAIRIGQP